MTRRARLLLAFLALALLLAAGSLHWASRPQRLTGALLDRVGTSLGLEVTAGGASEYTLGGDPRLVLRDLVARQPDSARPILRVARAEISLPWSTIRARGAVLDATRLELDDPQLDLQALRRWQATRPPAAAPRVPTLTRGVAVRGGRLDGPGWQVERINIDVPEVRPGRPVRADVEGELDAGTLHVPFDLALGLSRPAAGAIASAHGRIEPRMPDWRMPMRVQASGTLRPDATPSRIDAFAIGAQARYVGADAQAPFVFGMAGALRFADGVSLLPAGVALRSGGAIPTLDAGGRIAWRDGLSLELDGALARWPDAWPALPAPLERPRTPVAFALGYRGPADLSGKISLRMRHGRSIADARFLLPDVLAWIEAGDTGSPLPPLTGRLHTPKLEIAGATLEGVQIEIPDDAGDEPAGGGTARGD